MFARCIPPFSSFSQASLVLAGCCVAAVVAVPQLARPLTRITKSLKADMDRRQRQEWKGRHDIDSNIHSHGYQGENGQCADEDKAVATSTVSESESMIRTVFEHCLAVYQLSPS